MNFLKAISTAALSIRLAKPVRMLRLGTLCPTLLLSLLVQPLLSHSSWADPPRRSVQSIEDFVVHIRAHRERTVKLGLEILKKFSTEFFGVDSKVLEEYLKLHDQGKLDFPDDPKRGPAYKLYEHYGKNVANLNDGQRARAQEVIKDINQRDDQVARDFFDRHAMGPRSANANTAEKFRTIEKIADQVDRGMAPISSEEFGKSMQPASSWMSQPLERTIAKSFEIREVYDKAVNESNYDTYRARLFQAQCVLRQLGTF